MADVFAYLEGFGASGGSPNKSTIIVTAPTGSTVTCKMGSTTKTATEKSGVWTFGGLDLGTWTITSTKGGDSATQDVVITRLTVEYITIAYRTIPEFTYTGDHEIVDDSDNPISDFASWKGNWKIRFLTSGIFTVTKLNGWNGQLDVFLVGGGGGSSTTSTNEVASGGGGGGYTVTATGIAVNVGTSYSIIVGAGGSVGTAGGVSSAFGKTASGGNAGVAVKSGAKGGAGGSGGGAGGAWQKAGGNGGSDGGDGISTGLGNAGAGQGTTTREFGESSGKLYSGGGGGGTFKASVGTGGAGGGANGSDEANGISAAANTGGGAGGAGVSNLYGHTGAKGGSGIVIARNARGAA